jgi:hypothetical protein
MGLTTANLFYNSTLPDCVGPEGMFNQGTKVGYYQDYEIKILSV